MVGKHAALTLASLQTAGAPTSLARAESCFLRSVQCALLFSSDVIEGSLALMSLKAGFRVWQVKHAVCRSSWLSSRCALFKGQRVVQQPLCTLRAGGAVSRLCTLRRIGSTWAVEPGSPKARAAAGGGAGVASARGVSGKVPGVRSSVAARLCLL